MDYKKLKLMVGLEIHQQLDGKKLFCDCPTLIVDDNPDTQLLRLLRASAGETGKVDRAAKHEQLKEKHFKYQFYNSSCCLVEIDEEPPHDLNKDALETALIVAKLLNAEIIDEIQIMRKIVVDGSNVGGFQRTALIATNGYLETSYGRVGIDCICLEEDSAKIVRRGEEFDLYNLSRLGIL